VPDATLIVGYRLVVFDADDTLRRTIEPGKPCPHSSNEWVLMPRVREVLGRHDWESDEGPRLGLASNQDQVGYGLLSYDAAHRLLRDLAYAATGITPDEAAIQLCPHSSTAGCCCRKPAPGMLVRIMQHYGISADDTVFVGNAEVDQEAARRAGVAFVWAADLFGREEL
jgi:D-glycero-D-manno-heptose 1,7-bisphosphate phosphatase